MKKDINHWVEAISAFPEKKFFNIIRLYLGEVKTPYNKQRLISQLASFIKIPENISSIISLLDKKDICILTAILYFPKASQKTILDFFSGEFPVSELYTKLINLSERLIIYSAVDSSTNQEAYFINPLLYDSLIPYLCISSIFPKSPVVTYSLDDVFCLSPNFLTSFISYIRIHGINCKADGVIKKNDLNRLDEIFPGKTKCIQLLMNAFINLNLVREDEKKLPLNEGRLKAFCNFSAAQQYSLLCAASVSRFGRDGLRKEAQILLDCISSIPECGFSKELIIRLAYLVGNNSEDGNALSKKSRFTEILEKSKNLASDSLDSLSEENANLLELMIDSAIEFGLINYLGRDENGVEIYGQGNFINDSKMFEDPAVLKNLPKVLNIDSTFTVTLMPGLPLSALLPLTSFMMIKKYGIVTEFEISRQSVSVSFDEGWSTDDIFQKIEEFTHYELPQNLKINIQEWYSSYSSAMLYHGYVLKVTDSNISLAENNPNIKKYIKEKLADGIFLLNIPSSMDIKVFMEESGLDFLGNVKTSDSLSESLLFPQIREGRPISIFNQETESKDISAENAESLIKNLQAKLDSLNFEPNKKECLYNRINNRLILSEQQLTTASIRIEILEADGMDFAGKLHLTESAIKDESPMEITMPSPDGSGKFFTIIGLPLSISKQVGEAVIRFQIEPTKEIENILASRITHLRKLRF